MDYQKLTSDEIRGFDAKQSRETEEGIRKELASIRMDPYANQASSSSKARLMKKSLARVLTLRSEGKVKIEVKT